MARRRPADDGGQMMVLAAIVLLVSFIALAGMVARVNQLGSETALEGGRTVLDEVGPFTDSLDQALCRLKDSTHVTFSNSTATTLGSATLTGTGFTQRHVGMVVSGSGIPPGSRVEAVASATSLTLSQAATSTTTAARTFTPCLPQGTTTSFLRSASTTPTLEATVVALLEQVQVEQAAHGLLMDWEFRCGEGADLVEGTADDTTSGSVVEARLWDGIIWVEVQSSIRLTRSTACATSLAG